MIPGRLLVVVLVALLPFAAELDAQGTGILAWEELPPLPDPIGFAGAFVGVAGDALVVAGGANFPGGRPWDGHPKVWHDDIYLLREPDGAWEKPAMKLPRPTGYGVSETWLDRSVTPPLRKMVCVGGGDAERHFVAGYLLSWDGTSLSLELLPDLPGPMAFGCGALVGDTLYVAGGLDAPDAGLCRSTFWALDLAAEDRAWQELPTWPGRERMLSVAGSQSGVFHLIGGVALTPGPSGPHRTYLQDASRYVPSAGWQRMETALGVAAAPSPAFALGPTSLVVVGGDPGDRAPPAGDSLDRHPGFSGLVESYDGVVDGWSMRGFFPVSHGPDPQSNPNAGVWAPVTTGTAVWRGRYVIASGEVRPGVRTPRVFWGKPIEAVAPFARADWIALVLYMAALVAMGIYLSRRGKSTEDFFLAGRRIPWWAAGISIFGTQLSAITFMAIPAKSYATNWTYFLLNMGIVAITPLVVAVYLPFFRRLDVTTAYEYLERRFSGAVRLLGSASFILFQLGRMGVVMFLPALALAAVTGLNIYLCIIVMGVLCTIYTVLGGIEAVIWTDVLQVIVLVGGALLALSIIIDDIGFARILEVADAHDKFRLTNRSWDWTTASLPVILISLVFTNLVPYTTDQAVIQRYLTTKDERAAKQAIWTNAILCVPASILFFAIGTALFAYYSAWPLLLNPSAPTDQIFPWFIASHLPAGIAGLVIAGIFAAAMSSLDSSMNSIATASVTDFYRRWQGGRDDAHYLRLAKRLTILLGAIGTGTALLMATFEIKSLLDTFLALLGLLGGTLAGLFLLGVFTRRVSAGHALTGAAMSLGLLAYVYWATPLNGLLYAAIGAVTCFVTAFAASFARPSMSRPESALTVFGAKTP